MSKILNEEIESVENELNSIEALIHQIQDTLETEQDAEINQSRLIGLEQKIEQLTNRKIELLKLRFHQDYCEHKFVDDLIDIDPDRSVFVKYCKYCLYCE